MAKACLSSPSPLLSSGQSLAAPVAERVWALSFPGFSGAYLCLWSSPRPPAPPTLPRGLTLTLLPSITSTAPPRPPQDQDGGQGPFLSPSPVFVPGVARRQDKGSSTHRQRGSAITAALVWTH